MSQTLPVGDPRQQIKETLVATGYSTSQKNVDFLYQKYTTPLDDTGVLNLVTRWGHQLQPNNTHRPS